MMFLLFKTSSSRRVLKNAKKLRIRVDHGLKYDTLKNKIKINIVIAIAPLL